MPDKPDGEPEEKTIHIIDAEDGSAVVRTLRVIHPNVGTPIRRGQSIVTVIITDAAIGESPPDVRHLPDVDAVPDEPPGAA